MKKKNCLPFSIKYIVSKVTSIKENKEKSKIPKNLTNYQILEKATHINFGKYQIYLGCEYDGNAWYLGIIKKETNYNFKKRRFEGLESGSPDSQFAKDIFTCLEKIKELKYKDLNDS